MKAGSGQRPDIKETSLRLNPTESEPAPGISSLQGDVLAALREVLARAQAGDLELTSVGNAGLAAVVDRDTVRLTLIVEVSDAGHGLSPRELQIARLVADGATNHAIARTLDISIWTVSTHLRRIFAKLGVCTRAEMVAQLFGTPRLNSQT
jgi:DNA-binding CsgD family transcriptional regulator